MTLTRNILQVEVIINVVVWSSAVLYSIYRFSISTNRHFRYYEDDYSDFTQGWSFLNRKKDRGDSDWRIFKFLIKKLSLWVISSAIVSEILRKFKLIQVLQLWQISISIIFVTKELGIYAVGIILFQPLLFMVVLKKRNKLAVWLCNIFALTLIALHNYFETVNFYSIFNLTYQTGHCTIIATAWMNLRCASYWVDFIDESKEHRLLKYLSYCLYLPTLVSGPFISYKDFKGCHQFTGNLFNRFITLLIEILRLTFWFIFIELCLHFIYVNAIVFHLEWIKSFDPWSFFGYGYTMGQFFHLKYLVLYGLAISFAKFESVKVPSLPVCIGRIHLYSDMWKYFDVGMYNFMVRYIYIPLMKNRHFSSQLFSSFLCFIFVFVWHGLQYFVLIWSVLNFIGIVIEASATYINRKFILNSNLYKRLGPIWFRRISCMFGSPLLAMSAISNFYFFAGAEVGHMFVSQILNDLFSTVILLIILYSACQVSTEVKLKKEAQKRKTK